MIEKYKDVLVGMLVVIGLLVAITCGYCFFKIKQDENMRVAIINDTRIIADYLNEKTGGEFSKYLEKRLTK